MTSRSNLTFDAPEAAMEHPPTTILINARGGTAKQPGALDGLQALLRTRIPWAEVHVLHDPSLAPERAAAAVAAGHAIVAVAGGDGTINTVVQAVVNTPTRLGVLPFGTFNHFARDLGIPLDLSAAVDLLASGTTRQVDTGSVNDHFFVNNASIGVYTELVILRESGPRELAKSTRLLKAMPTVLRHSKPIHVELDNGLKNYRGPVWFVFTGNNSYGMDIFRQRHRQRLDGGKLDLVVVRAHGRTGVRQFAQAAMSSEVPEHDIERAAVEHVTINLLRNNWCRVAYDGEVVEMAGPIVFRSCPQALAVIAPAPAP